MFSYFDIIFSLFTLRAATPLIYIFVIVDIADIERHAALFMRDYATPMMSHIHAGCRREGRH